MPARVVAWIFSAGAIAVGANAASAQNFPNKPIRLVTAEAGGGADFLARLIAQGLAGSFGQQVIVDNRGAASGVVAADTVAKAPPDGYTLLLYSGVVWTLPFMRKVPYDPARDFSPITLAAISPNILVVNPAVPANSVTELIALAKDRPGQLSYGSSGIGVTPHLAAELFKAMAGVNIVHVPYKGQALNELIGGQVQLMFPNAASVAPHLKSGRLRPLAVTSAQPSKLFPDLPTMASSGLPGYESVVMFGTFAPAKTPAALVARLNQEIVQSLNKSDTREKLLAVGVETVGNSQEQFAAAIKTDMARWSKVIKDAGIRAD
jgi:tripartite-type tricarboxylate transporter receptor subunit TctC